MSAGYLPPSVTVVVCAYTQRRWDDLTAAVASVRSQRYPAGLVDVVLVVDHNPALLDRCRAAYPAESSATRPTQPEHPHQPEHPVRVVASTGRPGLSGARNTGVAHAAGEVVGFLDDDAQAAPGWLEALVAPYRDADVLGVGGAVVPAWADRRPKWFPAEFDWVVGCGYTGLPETTAEIRNPIGAAMSVRRAAFDVVGDFTDGIGRVGTTPMGCEETEFFIRLRDAVPGSRVVYAPDAVVRHKVGSERARWSYFARRCYAEGQSKALVAGRVGSSAALAAERRYVRAVLPRAVVRDLAPGGSPDRAAAVAAGLGITTIGYLHGLLAATRQPTEPASATWCALVDLDDDPLGADPQGADPRDTDVLDTDVLDTDLLGAAEIVRRLPEVPATAASGTPFRHARLLLRRHGQPLGFVTVEVTDGRVDVAALQDALIERALTSATRAVPAAPAEPAVLTPMPTSVSVVVCTRDRASSLRGCLTSLAAITRPDVDVVVVDNAPVDGTTKDAFDEIVGPDPRFRYVVEPRPGLSHARNRGLATAAGDVVAFTDDDVQVDPSWVDGLVRGFGRRPDVACVTGLVVARELDGPVQAYFDARVSWSTSCQPRVYDADPTTGGSRLHPFSAGLFGTGANFAFRADVLRALGGFDVALGAGTPTGGGEDLDAFLRVLLAGHALAYEPAALVWHGHRADLAGLRHQMFNYGSGLSAYLTKYLGDRTLRRRLVAVAPAGLAHLRTLSARAAAADGVAARGPRLARGLRVREAAGLLAGPALLLRSQRSSDRSDPGATQ